MQEVCGKDCDLRIYLFAARLHDARCLGERAVRSLACTARAPGRDVAQAARAELVQSAKTCRIRRFIENI